MKILKGKSVEYLAREFPEMAKKYWGMHIWARGYCVSTVGMNEEVIREYIRKQQEEEIKEEQRRLWKDNGMTLSGVVVPQESHRQGRW